MNRRKSKVTVKIIYISVRLRIGQILKYRAKTSEVPKHQTLIRYTVLSLLVLLLAACRPAATATPPTATPFPVFNYVSPTPQTVFLTDAAQTPSPGGVPTLDPTKIAFGQSRYTALACDSCHGADGKGTPKGSSLIGMALSQDDFITLLRSGGKMGSTHQYSNNRLSDTGAGNLYLYILSLGQSK